VDDGADTLVESMHMMQMEYDQGVRYIIATPHFRKEMFETPQERIEKEFLMVQESAQLIGDGLTVFPGCEFHFNMDMVETLNADKRFTLAGSRYVLTEFSSMERYPYIREGIYDLVSNGYIPIIAHAERCESFYQHFERIQELIRTGARIQINAGSIFGKNGIRMKRFCKQLMKQDLLDFIGTDAHGSEGRAPNMGECAAYIRKQMGEAYTKRILIDNPLQIIENKA